jgi:hypothetical protein
MVKMVSVVVSQVVEVALMLEITQEILEKVDPLLDAPDTDSAGKLLIQLDRTSVCALLIHVLRERGSAVAGAVAAAYLQATADQAKHPKAA